MNGRLAKKLRKNARERDREILPELKSFINIQPFKERLRFAWKILRGQF